MRKRSLSTVAAAVGLLLAGCGSSTATTSSASTSGGSTTSVGGSTTSVATPSGGPTSSLWVSGPVPSVNGATDLSKEPTIAAGASPAPTVVTAKDLVVGTGTAALATSTVVVQYVGTIYGTGKVFDASWTDTGPTQFPLNGVIPGFKDAIVGMKVGGRREVVIPPAEGYGAQASGPIPANSTLVFVIDLLKVS